VDDTVALGRYKVNKESNKPFDITAALERLIRHIVDNCPELAHVDAARMIIACMCARAPGTQGVYASIQPLRFKDGMRTIRKHGRTWTMPEVKFRGKEILYIIYFAVPRFLEISFQEKLTTIFHELYHINPEFNGDLRRFPGRNYAHGHSRKAYNERLQPIISRYLQSPGAEDVTAFLHLRFKDLEERYGGVSGNRLKRNPKPTAV